MDGQAPARQRLGVRRRVSAPSTDAWREILSRQEEDLHQPRLNLTMTPTHASSEDSCTFPRQMLQLPLPFAPRGDLLGTSVVYAIVALATLLGTVVGPRQH